MAPFGSAAQECQQYTTWCKNAPALRAPAKIAADATERSPHEPANVLHLRISVRQTARMDSVDYSAHRRGRSSRR
jgi:hypothetical protein